MKPISYRRHRFPPVIIQHAVRLYFRFTLSYPDVEDLLAVRGELNGGGRSLVRTRLHSIPCLGGKMQGFLYLEAADVETVWERRRAC